MADLPKISIVVPNLNGGATIGKTLQSLVGQNYPDLEILVVDGGSSDRSLDVIKEYEDHIAWWVSEKDRGQTSAINKGLKRCTGEIMNWLCSDDVLLPGSLTHVGRHFADNREADVLAGAGEIVFLDGRQPDYVERPAPKAISLLPAYNGIIQQSCFWRKRAIGRSLPLDESLNYAMDVELWCYLKSMKARWEFTDKVLGRFVLDDGNKTTTGRRAVARELEKIYLLYSEERIPLSFWYKNLRYPFEKLLRRDRGPLRLGILRILQVFYMIVFMPFYGYGKVRYMSWPE